MGVMRASNSSHVIAIFALLLVRVQAQPDMSIHNIKVSPPTLTQGQPYNVTWDVESDTFIGDIFLEDVSQSGGARVVQTIQAVATPCLQENSACQTTFSLAQSSVSFLLSATLSSSGEYVVGIQYANTSVALNPISQATGSLLFPASSNLHASIIDGTPTTPNGGFPLQTSGQNASQPSLAGTLGNPGPSNVATQSPPASSVATPSTAASSNTATSSAPSSGLSTGAKVGIAVGAAALFLLVLIGALLCWRQRRQRKNRALSSGVPYTHKIGSANRDLTAEKEMNVMSSPVTQFTPTNTWGTDFGRTTPTAQAPQTHRMSQANSWAAPEEHIVAPYADELVGIPNDSNRMSTHSPTSFTGSNTSRPSQTPVPAVTRKPVGVPVHHLHEPGMSEDEIARLEEEERRIDEAIAEAERRKELQRRDS